MLKHAIRVIKVFKYGEYGEYDDVITQFDWAIVFTDGVSESASAGRTTMPLPPPGITLKPIDEVTDEDYLEWVLQDIGASTWESMQQVNTQRCERLTRELEYQVHYDVSIEAIQLYNKVLEI
jgi:hypothetical protein